MLAHKAMEELERLHDELGGMPINVKNMVKMTMLAIELHEAGVTSFAIDLKKKKGV